MATVKIGWLLFNLLGYPTAFITVIYAIFGDTMLSQISEPYRSVVIMLGIVFMVIKIWTGIENNIEKRIQNKKSELEYKNLKLKSNNHKH